MVNLLVQLLICKISLYIFLSYIATKMFCHRNKPPSMKELIQLEHKLAFETLMEY